MRIHSGNSLLMDRKERHHQGKLAPKPEQGLKKKQAQMQTYRLKHPLPQGFQEVPKEQLKYLKA
ncbi:MAG: hypothetical protein CMI30_11490 [Opitutae bacterium]|nr:hypothetical protein [Opitutae bacterium]